MPDSNLRKESSSRQPRHTPGPWEFHEANVTQLWYEDTHAFSISKNYHEGIGVYVRCDHEHEKRVGTGVAEANARLVAAAPDLLAALEECEDELTTVHLGGLYPSASDLKRMRRIVDKSRRAIAKAQPEAHK